jgi:hypothetical protein
VYVYSGTFIMNDGEISGNTTTSQGGGVYNNGIFTVGGESIVRENIKNSSLNNVYLAGYKFITLGKETNAPATGMKIYINTPGIGGIVVQSGAAPSDAIFFEADTPGQTIAYEDGMLAIDLSLNTDQLDFYMQVAAYADAAGDVSITRSQNLTLPIPVVVPSNAAGKILTIKSSTASRTLTRGFLDVDSYSGLFIVPGGAKLVFENIVIDGSKENYTTNTATLVRVNNGGSFTMGSNAVLKNNRASSGGAVYVYSGTFIMNDGEITGNTVSGSSGSGGGVYNNGTFTMNSGKISENTATSQGGGVYTYYSSTFTMNGGEISENTVSGSSGSGGGVYNNGTFTMNSGFITNNTATNQGGGVYNYNTFTMNGGYLIGNTASLGGGVYISGSSTFNMKGGEISENIATSSAENSGGGGVYNYSGTFNMSGGKITGNKAANGGGVYNYHYTSSGTNPTNYNYTFNLGGTAVIKENVKTSDSSKNNVYLRRVLTNSGYITLGNGSTNTGSVPAPASGMDIYINFPSTTGSVIVNSGATAEHAVYFHADDSTKTVEYQASGSRLVLADAADPGGITITFDATDEAPAILGNVIIYRSNNIAGRPRSVTLMITGSFTDPQWYWNDNLLSSANSVTLSVDTPYGKLIGEKFLTLEVMVNGKPYSRMISFWVEQ